MVNKVFRGIAVILTRISGIVFTLVSLGILYYSLYICKNLVDILSTSHQYNLSGWRLLGLFLLNLLGLLFDWSIAAVVQILGICMILYKTKDIDKLINLDI